jgi:hypothetical protein
MGGLALSFWERFRNTHDVDVLLGVDHEHVGAVLESLGRAGILPKKQPPVLDLGSVRIVQLLYQPPSLFMAVRIDLLLAESDFHREALARRVPAKLEGLDIEVYTVSCEDLVILKLTAGRVIDRADASELLRLNHDRLDFVHLSKWLHQLNLGVEFAEIWREAFPDKPLPTGS